MQLVYETHRAPPKQAVAIGSELLARAFFSDPLFSRVQPSDPRRRSGLPAVFAACMRQAALRGGVWWCPEAVLGWLPLRNLSAGLSEQLMLGYAAIPLRFGLWASWRLQTHGVWCERRMAALVPEDAAYVFMIGVEPDLAGRGIGSKLMNDAFAKMAEQHAQCALRTEQPKNVRFYERLGFTCVEQAVVPATGVPVWFFVRPLTR